MATARSPSPNPSRAKTPDNSSRRSTKPPSISIDPHLRNSCSKENEKRSTVHSSGKASKNFMAPTISAASKVAAPSPRKKILRERNELSHSLETANLASPEIFGGSSRNSVVVPLPEVAAPSPRKQPQLCSPSPADAAGADSSSVPPYDPNTNYLSPRPQFLHYRPNPRIDNYASTEGKGLEASFSSESDDDCGAVAAEEKDSEEECSTPSVPSEVEEEEEEAAALDETLVVEPEPDSKDSKPFKPLHPRRSKLAPFLLVVAIACVFMPLSDSPVISSPVPNDQSLTKLYSPPSGMYEDWRLGEYRAVASVKLHDLASRLKRWSRDSVAYFSSAPAGEVGLVGLVNMTSPADDAAIGSDFIYKHELGIEHELEVLEVVSEGSAENYEAEGKEMNVSGEIKEIDDTKHEAEGEAIEVEVSGAVNEVAEFETELVLEEVSEAIEMESEALDEVAEYEAEKVDDTKHLAEGEAIEVEVSGAVNEVAEFETELVVEEESEAIEKESEALDEDAENSAMENVEYEAEKVDTEVYKNVNAAEFRADKFETEVPENGAANIDEPTTETHQDSSHIQPATSSQVMVGLSAAFLLLVVAVVVAAFLCIKQKKTPTISAKEMHTSKKVVGSVSYTPTKGKGSEDLMGDLGYSVASSGLDNTFLYGQHHQTKRGEEEEDNLSHERRPRRDSTASSSVSYGSFTTYERLSAKKGYKDEEVVVTPVRRSSRLRSHVTTSS